MDVNQSQVCPVIGIPVGTSVDSYPVLQGEPDGLCPDCKLDKRDSISVWIDKFLMKANYQVQGIKEYARFLQVPKAERVFRKAFAVDGGRDEKLVKSLRCFLSTTAGPIVGLLFISTKKIAFISDKPLRLPSQNGAEVTKFHYKVVIPLSRIKKAIPVMNPEMPSKKYVRIVTVDEFDFWFMGVGNQKLFNRLTL